MAYSLYTELAALTGSALAQATLEAIIAQSDRAIDAKLRRAGITGANTTDLKAVSLEYSIAGLLTRYRLDGTKPASLSMGGFSMSDNIDSAIDEHMKTGDELLEGIIKKNRSYRQIVRVVNKC